MHILLLSVLVYVSVIISGVFNWGDRNQTWGLTHAGHLTNIPSFFNDIIICNNWNSYTASHISRNNFSMFQSLNEFPFQTSATLTYITLVPQIEKKLSNFYGQRTYFQLAKSNFPLQESKL